MVKAREVSDEALSLSASVLLEIDKICRQFEAELKAGKQPQMEAFLGDTPEPQRSELRRELEAIQREQGSPGHHATLAQFVQNLVASGLMTEEHVQQILDDLSANEQPQSADDLANLLHRQGHLTKFQAKAVYQGKTRGLVLGNYVVLDKIGRGGMGQVFKARHCRMDRVVALKMLPAAAMKHPEAVKRFQREARAAAKLSHANIVTAFDADEADDIHFMVMECVEGQDLASLVKEQGPLDPAKAVDYILQAAAGLEYAHRHGVIHRDIKPSNILLDGEGVIKILDMGLARIEDAATGDDALTATGQVMGTLDFMSPEQALDTRSADARADIYSLGCTLYYLLTGQTPFGGDTMTKKILAHRQQPVPSLRQSRPDMPEALDTAFQQMLAKEPVQRQTSMVEVIDQLGRCGVTAGSGPPPLPQKQVALAETLSTAADEVDDTSTEAGSDISLARSVVTPDPINSKPRGLRSRASQGKVGQEKGARTRWGSDSVRPWVPLGIGLGALGIAGLLLGLYLLLRSGDQVVRVEIDPALLNDAAIKVSLDGKELEIAGVGETIKLKPGEHGYEIRRGDERILSREFTVVKGEETVIRIEIPAQPEPGFVSLFDGTTFDGWSGKSQHFFIEDGMLVSSFGDNKDASVAPLLTNQTYDDFHLRLDYRVSTDGNSGVLVRSPSSGSVWLDALEIKIADPDATNLPQASQAQADRTVSGSLFDVCAAESGYQRPCGEWNSMQIICQGPQLRVTLNGSVILDKSLDSLPRQGVSGQDHPGLVRQSGRVGLIGFGARGRVEYRNIRIKELADSPDRRSSRLLGYMVHKRPENVQAFKSYTNVVLDRGWVDYGDALIKEAANAGTKVVLCQFGPTGVDKIDDAIELARRYPKTVAGICLRDWPPGRGLDLSSAGRRIQRSVPGIQVWAYYGTKYRGPEAVPDEVDVLLLGIYEMFEPSQVQSQADALLSGWIPEAKGRPIVLQWTSWGSTPRPPIQVGTMRMCAQICDRYGMRGLAFDCYENDPDEGQRKGIESTPALVAEIKQIAHEWGIQNSAPAN